MTRTQCQNKIEELLQEAVNAYMNYNPLGEYLSLDYVDGYISFDNLYYSTDRLHPIEYSSWDLAKKPKAQQKCETKIAKLMNDAVTVYKEYNPQGEYLSCAFLRGKIMVNNAYYREDKEKPINFSVKFERED